MAEETYENEALVSEEEIGDLLRFDPFDSAPAEEEPAEESETPAEAEEAPAEEETPSEEEEGGEDPGPSSEDEPPSVDPEKELLRQQLETMQKLLQQRTAEPPKEEPKDAPPVPAYQFEIPDALVEGLDSDNPVEKKAAVGALAQGLSAAIHQQMIAQVQQMIQQAVPQLVQSVVAEHTTSQEIFHDFYGKYADLNRPELRTLVRSVAEQVYEELKPQQWTPEVRDTIAQRVYGIIGKKQTRKPAAKPPKMVGGSSGGAPRQEDKPSASDEILDTLFGGR